MCTIPQDFNLAELGFAFIIVLDKQQLLNRVYKIDLNNVMHNFRCY